MEPGTLPLDPMDYHKEPGAVKINPGHGTRTASIICGNWHGKYKGVAPGLPLIPYRAVNGVDLTTPRSKSVAQALRHAVEENACEVASISLGTPARAKSIGAAVDAAYGKGVIVVAAGGQVIDRAVYPARYGRCIGVGGVRKNHKAYHRYYYDSSTGEDHARYMDVWAPALDVPVATTYVDDDGSGQFIHDQAAEEGTSYATAHVAAAAAMWLAYHYDALDEQYPKPWQRIEGFRTLIRATGTPIKGKYPRDKTARILDIEALLNHDLPDVAKLKRR